jgi:hypothetical protein
MVPGGYLHCQARRRLEEICCVLQPLQHDAADGSLNRSSGTISEEGDEERRLAAQLLRCAKLANATSI